VYRRTVQLNPLIAVLSVLFFVDLAGVVGAVIAVPAAATGQILLREFLAMRRERLAMNSPP
jgi:predicted PurR-regulated permease PerM